MAVNDWHVSILFGLSLAASTDALYLKLTKFSDGGRRSDRGREMERRKSTRACAGHDVEMAVGGQPTLAHVYDLSMDGCMIETEHGSVRPSDLIAITFLGQVVSGRVVWQKRRTAGVQFSQPLAAEVVAELTFQAVDADDTFRRDQFGRDISIGRGRNAYLRFA